ncbi:MAG: glycine cleavage system aminomethyltransferase GcvT [Opitutales bacterium]
MKESPLHQAHLDRGGKLVEFGGWSMPVQFAGIRPEHEAVRSDAGVFDISHMGNVVVSGPKAEDFVQNVFANDTGKLAEGQGQYSFMLNENGGVIDDLIIYREAPDSFYVVLNAAVLDEDLGWLKQHLPSEGCDLDDESAATAGIALQGPNAEAVLRKVFSDLTPPARNFLTTGTFNGAKCRIARTGYTGEDGFELFVSTEQGVALWEALIAAGPTPCGLGARDTLRLEAGLPLNGSDLGPDITPVQAGFKKFVALNKPVAFVGQGPLVTEVAEGPKRRLRAFKIEGKAPPPRAHYLVKVDGEQVGEVTSGILSPTLGLGMGYALVEAPHAAIGNTVDIEIRGKLYPATLVKRPIYRRT